jgi:hypothetical protein
MGSRVWFQAKVLPNWWELSRGGGCSSLQEAMEGSVDCLHTFRHLALSNPAPLSLPGPPPQSPPDPTAPPPYEDFTHPDTAASGQIGPPM